MARVTVRSRSGPPRGPGDADAVVYTPDPNFAGTDTFTYTAVDGQGDNSTATVTVYVQPVVASGGSTQPVLGNGVQLDPTQPLAFTPSGPGDATTTWQEPAYLTDGSGRPASGMKSTTVTVTSTADPDGNWTYVERLTWHYDVSGGDGQGSTWHSWGNYSYTLDAFSLGSTKGYTFVFNSSDSFSNTIAARRIRALRVDRHDDLDRLSDPLRLHGEHHRHGDRRRHRERTPEPDGVGGFARGGHLLARRPGRDGGGDVVTRGRQF